MLDRDGDPGPRILEPQRYFPRNVDHHRWLKASPTHIAQPSAARSGQEELARVRITARIHPTRDQIEFGLQYELPEWDQSADDEGYGERIFARKRFWPKNVTDHRWKYTSDINFTVHYREFFDTMDPGGTLGEVPHESGPPAPETVESCVAQITVNVEAMVANECNELLVDYCESNQDNAWCRDLIAARAAEAAQKHAGADEPELDPLTPCIAFANDNDVTAGSACDPILTEYCEDMPGDLWCLQRGLIEPLPVTAETPAGDKYRAEESCLLRVQTLGKSLGTACQQVLTNKCEENRRQPFCTELGLIELGPADYISGSPLEQCVYWVHELGKPVDPHCTNVVADAEEEELAAAVSDCRNRAFRLDKQPGSICDQVLEISCAQQRLQQVCWSFGYVELSPAGLLPDGTPVEQCMTWIDRLYRSAASDPQCAKILQDYCDSTTDNPWCIEHRLSSPSDEESMLLDEGPPGPTSGDGDEGGSMDGIDEDDP